jgi:formylmethanofuran dehydrogenase subunit A
MKRPARFICEVGQGEFPIQGKTTPGSDGPAAYDDRQVSREAWSACSTVHTRRGSAPFVFSLSSSKD